MAVNVKLGVDIGEFTSGIKAGQQQLKGLNAEMKASEAEFKATGDAEKKLADQTKTLNSQLQVQKGIADKAKKALDAMTKAGVDPADEAYQKLYVQMMNAQAGANEAQAALNALGNGAAQAADGADKLANSMNSIGKKISLDQVITGINSITSGMENAGRKAIELGKAIWDNIIDSARLADDTATTAYLLDMDVEKYQQYKGVFDTIGELTVKDWMNAKRKVEKAITDPSQDQIDVLKALGFTTDAQGKYGMGEYMQWGMVNGQSGPSLVPKDINKIADNWEQAFWEATHVLRQKVRNGELTNEMADVYGEVLFGKNYSSLKPLIDLGQEGFNAALKEQAYASEEAIKKNAELADAVTKLQNSYDALKMEVTSGLAPALTTATNTLDNLLKSVLEYLQTEEGQAMLKQLGDSVTQLFEGMKNINAKDIVDGFKTGFDAVTGSLQWIVDNKDSVVTAIEGVFGFWATLKVSSGVLTILKVINGLKDLAGLGSGAASSIATATGNALAGGTMAVSNLAGNSVLQNFIPAFGDWFTHEGPLGTVFQGVESIGEWFDRQRNEVQDRVASFADDWANNEMIKFWTRRDTNQNAADSTPFGADWRPSYMKDIQPVEIEAEPVIPTDANAEVQKQLDGLNPQLRVKLILDMGGMDVPLGTEWRPKANGMWAVPYDGYLASLHKGERIMPAREVSNRNFSSNMYIENMNMSNELSADALANAIASRNERILIGYGG